MEEDIKILEKIKENYKIHLKLEDKYKELAIMKMKAIENVLARLKELEKENKELKAITQAYNSYSQDSNCETKIVIADSEYFANGFFKENFIPKTKIEKEIKEYKELLKDAVAQVTYKSEIEYTIRVLNKLL